MKTKKNRPPAAHQSPVTRNDERNPTEKKSCYRHGEAEQKVREEQDFKSSKIEKSNPEKHFTWR